jgi:cobalt-zinc-cadmium resistance protein CzcA
MRIILSVLLLCQAWPSPGQSDTAFVLSPEEAVSLALENHPMLMNQFMKDAHERYALRSSWDLDPVEITYRSGELYGPENDRYLEINQEFGSLLQHISDYRLASQQVKLEHTEQEIRRKHISAEIRSAYYFWVYQQSRLNVLEQQQDLYSDFARIADLKYQKGEIDLTEKATLIAEAAYKATKLNMAYDELQMASNKIRQMTATEGVIVPSLPELTLYETEMSSDTLRYSDQLMAGYYRERSKLDALSAKSSSAAFFPKVSLGFIRQDIGSKPGLWAWQVGLAFPIWLPSKVAEVKQAGFKAEITENEYAYELEQINTTIDNLVLELNRTFKEILYYDRYGLLQANQLYESTRKQFENEEIEYVEYVRQLDIASSVMLEYLEVMNRYNQNAIQLEFYAH